MVSFVKYTLSFIILSTSINSSNGAFSEELSDAAKTTHLHFFFHDILSGNNPTSVKITGQTSNPSFGTIFMIDDVLTEDQDASSKVVGRAQGMYAMASQSDIALLMVVNYEFTEGKYKGSSISILGRNPVMDDVREMGIVGGSGLFRYARGYALAHTVWSDSSGDAIVEYNVYVQHQQQQQQQQQQFASSCGQLAVISKWWFLSLILVIEIASFSNTISFSLL